jgi:electron transport complex protein RnfG
MNETQSTPHSVGNSGKMLKAMVGIGIMCALLIVVTYEVTLPRVEHLKDQALQEAILKVLPGSVEARPYRFDENEGFVLIKEAEGTAVIYAGYDNQGSLVGLAIEASGQGYADVIRILYGYDPDKEQIIGFYVLESKETPGLGDKIEKDEVFLNNFDGLDVALNSSADDLKNEVVAVKSGTKSNPWEIDGITGATISSRAIASIIDQSAARWASRIHQYRHTINTKP